MVAPKKAKQHLVHALDDLAHFITQYSASPNHPKEVSTKDVSGFIQKLEIQIDHFANELKVKQPSQDKVAAEFKLKCDSLEKAIAKSLQSHDNDKSTTNALKHLHKLIVEALTQLSKVYKVKSSVLTQTPVFTPHHGQHVIHLANEQRYKTQANRGPLTDNFRHYNIPPGSKRG